MQAIKRIYAMKSACSPDATLECFVHSLNI
jgi:hypothetical protein